MSVLKMYVNLCYWVLSNSNNNNSVVPLHISGTTLFHIIKHINIRRNNKLMKHILLYIDKNENKTFFLAKSIEEIDEFVKANNICFSEVISINELKHEIR